MKLVMSATAPLELDEIRVALSIVLGDPVWRSDRVPKDSAQLISLCGGNLLDLDEEDRKVRFIHHSVIQHLLSPAARPSTKPYHFSFGDAQNFTGATCVTYLNFPIFDTRMTITRNLKSDDVLDNVVQSTRQAHPVLSRLVQHIRSRDDKRGRTSQVDIGRIVTEIQAARIKTDLDPRCFLSYATNNWLSHTLFFDEEVEECKTTWKLWWRLLYGGVATVTPPCPNIIGEPLPALLWAVEHAHGSLFRNIICETSLRTSQAEELIYSLKIHQSIHDQWLGDAFAQYLYVLSQREDGNIFATSSTAENILMFLNLGADPTTPHHVSQVQPLRMLIPMMKRRNKGSSLADRDFIRRFLSYPAIQQCLGDPSLLLSIDHHLDPEESDVLAEILTVRPDLRAMFYQPYGYIPRP